ncbi:hypothetical protein ACFSTA_17005 [Ornithinibacillus salinisoli]|uniref:Uncharacterized protein n=1 Tax=Ornithinibacillus salinisoli TaxID=1848459 RepID=A0ABW4W3N7_9BACI
MKIVFKSFAIFFSIMLSVGTINTVNAESRTITELKTNLFQNEKFLNLKLISQNGTNEFILEQTINYDGNEPLILKNSEFNNITMFNQAGKAVIAKKFDYDKIRIDKKGGMKKQVVKFKIPDGTYKVKLSENHDIKMKGNIFNSRGNQLLFLDIENGEGKIVRNSNEEFFKNIHQTLKQAGINDLQEYNLYYMDDLNRIDKFAEIPVSYWKKINSSIKEGDIISIFLFKQNEGIVLHFDGDKIKSKHKFVNKDNKWFLNSTIDSRG